MGAHDGDSRRAGEGAAADSDAVTPAGVDGRVVFAIFLIGLLCRLAVFTMRHLEGDELVYAALVRQLMNGHGYNLIGATILGNPMVGADWPADQYGRALFFHPPGGIGFFWLLAMPLGAKGFDLAQILSFAAFFWSMMALARAVIPTLRGTALYFVAALAAFTPIMAHVVTHWWLDGPMLALTTLAAALFARAVERGHAGRAVVAGLVMGAASWVKTAAFVALPGVLLLGWAVGAVGSRRTTLKLAAVFAAVALLVQLPWELWQWAVVGSPFPTWAGKPSATLIAQNDYVRWVTVTRSHWVYLTLMPRVVWTLVPSIACLLLLRPERRTARITWATLLWIAGVLAVVITLGASGYSKLLRYAVLVTPATVLLAGLAADTVFRQRAQLAGEPRPLSALQILTILLFFGVALEVGQGFKYSVLTPETAVILPILGPNEGTW